MGYTDLLRTAPVFRRYFSGLVISFLGDWFTTVALYTAVAELSSSGRAVALVLVSKTLPIFLVSPLAGPLVDRLDRRRLLIATDFARFAGALALILCHRADSLVGLYVITALMTGAAGIAVPAKNAALPMIVAREDIPRANALAGGSWAAMLALGAALGGLATDGLGIDASFLIDGSTFLLSAWCFAGLPALPPSTEKTSGAGFIDGLRYLVRTPVVSAVAACKPAMHLSGGVFALLPLYGTIVFDRGGPLWIGVLYGIRGLGSLVGSLGLRLVVGDRPATMRLLLVAAFLGLSAGYVALSVATELWHAALLFGFTGLATGTIWVFSGTLLQLEADPRFHGRVFAVEVGLLTLVLAGSSLFAGHLVDAGYAVRDVTQLLSPLPLVGAGVAAVALVAARRR